ncbi:DUF4352 domain-containing protein [Knoellia koreensis]|uniref:DUF4352 domain-containing protein n=1 Tax=Knoellia koreensis TaxID=2730921 RepID=A0A849HD87_9MICO|nr:DUF4352 domain-containing protein [Knoellia sp. DB2414S]NNM45378.1 DUF4352 domain-containing protein [Knoellia sp. DB2414S]
MSQSPAGWYPQPDGRQRYWDGQSWTEHFAPGEGVSTVGAPTVGAPTFGAAQAAPQRAWYARKRVLIPGAIIALFVVIGALSGGGDEPQKDTASASIAADDKAAEPVSEPSAASKPGAAPKPTSKPSAKAVPVKPAAPKVGATVRDGKFAFTVRSVKCGIATVGTNPYLKEKAQGQFCAVALTVENIGDEPQSMFADNQYAFDSKGRKFSANSMASMADESSQVLWEEINPGNQVKGTVYFDLPKGASLAKVELHDSMFSGGVGVTVR